LSYFFRVCTIRPGPSLSRQPSSPPKLIHFTNPFPRHLPFFQRNFVGVAIEFVSVAKSSLIKPIYSHILSFKRVRDLAALGTVRRYRILQPLPFKSGSFAKNVYQTFSSRSAPFSPPLASSNLATCSWFKALSMPIWDLHTLDY
jgi:hypothetical protein